MCSTRAVVLSAAIALAAAGGRPALAQEDPGWPREFVTDDGAVFLIYQPQVETWDFVHIEARAAVAVTPAGDSVSVPGSFRLAASTQTNLDTRTVVITGHEITDMSFPALDSGAVERLAEAARTLLPENATTLALDRLLAGVEASPLETANVAVSMEPPIIFASERSAIIILLDGDPLFIPLADTDLSFDLNTNWDLFLHRPDSTYYLLNGDKWMTAAELDGEWFWTEELPETFWGLPPSEDWAEARLQMPPRRVFGQQAPTVFVSRRPAELILIYGTPKLVSIAETDLHYVENTDSDLFFHVGESRFYYLVSGRWFRATSLDGPWESAGHDLPEEFYLIPEDHLMADVLASVPGTYLAEEAVLQSQIPRTARVNRDEAAVAVIYNGEPAFEQIEGTSLSYAVNTDKDVIRAGDSYYLCYEGVWFVAGQPDGPWQVVDTIPEEIYSIPPSSPVYHTTYVHVYDSDEEEVYVGYTSGYEGEYVWDGVVVYGTGYYYWPYLWYGVRYPIYYARPYTYGAAAFYNVYTGSYARGAYAYGPYGGAARGAAYNPTTGSYRRGAAVWGPYGVSAEGTVYNPYTGTYAATRQAGNRYANWGESVVVRGDDWARTTHAQRGAAGRATVETSQGGRAVAARRGGQTAGAARTSDGDLYVGKDGEVYRRDQTGYWSKYSGGNWDTIEDDFQVERGDGQRAVELQAQSRFTEAERARAEGEGAQRQGAPQGRAAEAGGAGARAQAGAQRRGQGGQANRESVQQRLNRDARARAEGNRRTNEYRQYRQNLSQKSATTGRRRGGRRR